MNYAGCRVRLTNVAGDIDQAAQRLAAAQEAIEAQNAKLANLATTYAEVIAAIDAGAVDPGNDAWVQLKADKDQLVADFQALKATSQAMVDALAAL